LRATGRRAAGFDFDFADELRPVAGRAFDLDAEDDRDDDALLRSPPDEDSVGFDAGSLDVLSEAGFASAFASVAAAFAGLDSDEVSGSLSTARLRLFSESPLKSVSYQPPPFRRKTGADTSFFIAFLPHDGHFFRGASETFCSNSV
jgi:hypothetical protein